LHPQQSEAPPPPSLTNLKLISEKHKIRSASFEDFDVQGNAPTKESPFRPASNHEITNRPSNALSALSAPRPPPMRMVAGVHPVAHRKHSYEQIQMPPPPMFLTSDDNVFQSLQNDLKYDRGGSPGRESNNLLSGVDTRFPVYEPPFNEANEDPSTSYAVVNFEKKAIDRAKKDKKDGVINDMYAVVLPRSQRTGGQFIDSSSEDQCDTHKGARKGYQLYEYKQTYESIDSDNYEDVDNLRNVVRINYQDRLGTSHLEDESNLYEAVDNDQMSNFKFRPNNQGSATLHITQQPFAEIHEFTHPISNPSTTSTVHVESNKHDVVYIDMNP